MKNDTIQKKFKKNQSSLFKIELKQQYKHAFKVLKK